MLLNETDGVPGLLWQRMENTLFNFTPSSHQLSYLLPVIEFIYKRETCWIGFRVNLQGFYRNHKGQEQTRAVFSLTTGTLVLAHPHTRIAGFAHTPWLLQGFITAADPAKTVLTNPWNSAERTTRADANTMQHPLTGGTCVALPNVDMCPQLSCALTFMYLQQVSEWARARARRRSSQNPRNPVRICEKRLVASRFNKYSLERTYFHVTNTYFFLAITRWPVSFSVSLLFIRC